jgi:hypothetical protein
MGEALGSIPSIERERWGEGGRKTEILKSFR